MIATLKKELSAMEKIIKEYAEEKETLTEKVSKLQFDNTHLNDKIQQFNNMVIACHNLKPMSHLNAQVPL